MPCDIRGLVDHRLIGGGIPLLKDHGGPCIVRSLKVQCAEGAAALRAGAKASFTHQWQVERLVRLLVVLCSRLAVFGAIAK